MLTVPKQMSMHNRIPTTFLIQPEKLILEFIQWNKKTSRILKATLENKSNARGITAPDFKLYYTATVIKKSSIVLLKSSHVVQWGRMEGAEKHQAHSAF